MTQAAKTQLPEGAKTFEWRIFFGLLGAGLIGVVAVLPMVFDLLSGGVFKQAPAPEIPMPLVVALALVQNGVLLAVAIAIGMKLSKRVGLQMPLIAAWAGGGRAADVKSVVLPGLLLGGLTGAAMVAVEAAFFLPRLPSEMLPFFEVALWKRLLAGVLYGGVTEELLMRLFLMSLVAWLLGKWFRSADGRPAAGAFWAAIIFVAILFSIGHLPATAAIAPLTPLLVTRALVLNGLAGIAFGWLYWRRGLEAAMVGHMSTHLVMQVPGVMLLKMML